MWFDGWSDLVRTALVGTAGYVTLVVVLRLSGKRTLAKLNAFDFVVTVALGSTLATVLTSQDVSWSEGALALVVLVVLQLVVARLSRLLPSGRSFVTAQPTLLLADGVPLPEALRAARLTGEELRQGVRSSGSGALTDCAAVVLEPDGTLSVITRGSLGDASALEGVAGRERLGPPRDAAGSS